MSTLKYNTWLNTDNTENYKCRAWVNFNGTGTVAIRASGNVSSITDLGTGTYRANFINAMSDANYCTTVSATNNLGTSAGFSSFDSNNQSVSQTNIIFTAAPSTSNTYDALVVNVAVFR
jgi:hypothetical protein